MDYLVIDDYGDDWEDEDAPVAYHSKSLEDCILWAEENNYHSASIVEVNSDYTRKKVN